MDTITTRVFHSKNEFARGKNHVNGVKDIPHTKGKGRIRSLSHKHESNPFLQKGNTMIHPLA